MAVVVVELDSSCPGTGWPAVGADTWPFLLDPLLRNLNLPANCLSLAENGALGLSIVLFLEG